MPLPTGSLLPGRNTAPLSDDQIRQITNTFLGMDEECQVRYDPAGRTVFRVAGENGEAVKEVVFGPDIYPGQNVVDANSNLSFKAAVAHEITHFRRHLDMREIDEEHLVHIDEALTSLEAARRFPRQLSPQDIEQLIGDAIQRLILYVSEVRRRGAAVDNIG